jgi:hypothetical protein
MKIAASFLNTFGIMDAEEFLKKFSTYLLGKVFIPFVLGAGNFLLDQIVTICHEFTHADQDRKAGGLRFEWDYATSEERRAFLEADGYAAGLFIKQRYTRLPWNWPTQKQYFSSMFKKGYDIKSEKAMKNFNAQIEHSYQNLIAQDGQTTEVMKISVRYLDARVIQNRERRTV